MTPPLTPEAERTSAEPMSAYVKKMPRTLAVVKARQERRIANASDDSKKGSRGCMLKDISFLLSAVVAAEAERDAAVAYNAALAETVEYAVTELTTLCEMKVDGDQCRRIAGIILEQIRAR